MEDYGHALTIEGDKPRWPKPEAFPFTPFHVYMMAVLRVLEMNLGEHDCMCCITTGQRDHLTSKGWVKFLDDGKLARFRITRLGHRELEMFTRGCLKWNALPNEPS